MWQWFWDSKGWPDVKRTLEETKRTLKRVYERYRDSDDMVFYKEAMIPEEYTRKALYCAYEHHDCQELRDIMDKFAEVHESRVSSWWLKWQFKEGMTKLVLINGHWREDKKTTENKTEIVGITKEQEEEIDSVLDENIDE